jgi:hypothetical protein
MNLPCDIMGGELAAPFEAIGVDSHVADTHIAG